MTPRVIRIRGGHMNIKNKTVLITGANRGIGRALLEEALRRGARKVYAGTRGVLQHSDKRVTPLTLDVTSASQIEQAVKEVDTLDVLINNAGIAIYDDLGDLEVVEQTFAVNLLGLLRVTNAFLPLLKRSKGAILNNLSLAGLAPLPIIPSYSTSKAAALNLTQSLRALLADQGVTVHAVVIGPVDTDMSRGLEIPKAAPETAAAGIFDGFEKGEEEIFPDPVSQSIAEGWRNGVSKALEREFKAFVPIFFFNDTAPTEIYTLSLHDALPITGTGSCRHPHTACCGKLAAPWVRLVRSRSSPPATPLPPFSFMAANRPISRPAQNARPSPDNTTARTPFSWASRPVAATSASNIAASSAFILSARTSRTSAMPSEIDIETRCSMRNSSTLHFLPLYRTELSGFSQSTN